MATLKDMLARLFGQKTAQPASVFVTMDERNTPVDMRIGELTGDAYHKYIGDTVRQFDKRGYIPN